MGHFAKVQNGIVVQVIVADQEFVDSYNDFLDGEWVQTSYNTYGGIHYDANGKPDGGNALRKNYAGVGFTYDSNKDAFIPPRPFNSWSLNEETCLWESPIKIPNDGKNYRWDEVEQNWIEVV